MVTNKYTIIYNDIINRAKNRNLDGYYEIHSIIPTLNITEDLEGSTEYFVKLTPKENFVCHLCLLRMAENNEYETIEKNFHNLVGNIRNKNLITSRNYETKKLNKIQSKTFFYNISLDNVNNYV